MMTSQFDADNQGLLKQIAEALNTLANCAQAEEKRRRDPDRPVWMDEALDRAAAMMAARTSVHRAFDDIEAVTGLEAAEATKFQDSSSEFQDNPLDAEPELQAWKQAVARDKTTAGFTDWMAWQNHNTTKESDDRR